MPGNVTECQWDELLDSDSGSDSYSGSVGDARDTGDRQDEYITIDDDRGVNFWRVEKGRGFLNHICVFFCLYVFLCSFFTDELCRISTSMNSPCSRGFPPGLQLRCARDGVERGI